MVGLEEYLVGGESYRHTLHDFRQLLIDLLTHIGHNGILVQGDADAHSRTAVDKETIGLRFCIGTLHGGDVANANHLARRGAYKHIGNVLLVFQFVVHTKLQTVIAIFKVTGIHRLACILQTDHHLCRDKTRGGQFLLINDDVDDFGTGADNVDALHTLHRQQLATHQFSIFLQFGITVPVARESVEQAIDIEHVVHHDGGITSRWQFRLHIVGLAAQLVEVLFHLRHLHLVLELHTDDGHTGTAIRVQFLHVGQCSQLVLHHLHGLQFHLMRCGTRIDQHHRGLLHSHSRVFQLGHVVVAEHTHEEDTHHKTPEYNGSLDEKFCQCSCIHNYQLFSA